MFAWVSMLVDQGIFDTVDIFFLIVGHTHASIDQYFSVLAKQILSCEFIGSPLSLQALLGRERDYNLSGSAWQQIDENTKPRKAKPLLIRKLSVIFDLKTCLVPMIDFSIKYYSIPHRFKFEMYNGVVAMQYSIYSTQKNLLPPRPTTLSGECCSCIMCYELLSTIFSNIILFCYIVRI
jgi:hypothetical protein